MSDELVADRAPQAIQPRPSIVVGQRYARTHPGDRLWSVKIVAFQEWAVERVGESRPQRRLAAASYAHHDDGPDSTRLE